RLRAMPDNLVTPDPTAAPAPPPAPEAAHDVAPPEPSPEAHRADADEQTQEEAPARAAETAEKAGDEAPAPAAEKAAPEEPAPAEEPPPSNKRWYVVKVQSGREESIKEAIERRVKIEGLEEFFGQIIVPVERVTEIKNGKRVTKERKLYPGYLMCE